MTSADLGFSVFADPQRVERIVAKLSPGRQAQLRELEKYRREYFADLREFARQSAVVTLRRHEDGLDPEPAIALASEAADLAAQMSGKFSLAMIEILMFGKLQGELPALETSRIIE